jgi:hypothetical protein
MSEDENPHSYFDDWNTYVVNWNPKIWKPVIDEKTGELTLYKKGSTKDW